MIQPIVNRCQALHHLPSPGETYELVLNDSDEWVWMQRGETGGIPSKKLADRIVGRLVEGMFQPRGEETFYV